MRWGRCVDNFSLCVCVFKGDTYNMEFKIFFLRCGFLLGAPLFIFSLANAQSPGSDLECERSYNNCVSIYTPDGTGGGSFEGISEFPSRVRSVEDTCRRFARECVERQNELDARLRLHLRVPPTLHEAQERRRQAHHEELFRQQEQRLRERWRQVPRPRPAEPPRLASPGQQPNFIMRLMGMPGLLTSSVYDSLRWYR